MLFRSPGVTRAALMQPHSVDPIGLAYSGERSFFEVVLIETETSWVDGAPKIGVQGPDAGDSSQV